MYRKDVQRIVDAEPLLELHVKEADGACSKANQDGGGNDDIPRSQRDRDQSSHGGPGRSQHAPLAMNGTTHRHPGQFPYRWRSVDIDKGAGRERAGGQGAASVEAEPEQRRTRYGHGRVMRVHALLPNPESFAEHHRRHQRRNPGTDMHGSAARRREHPTDGASHSCPRPDAR